MAEAVQKAKDTLLRALDQLEQAEQTLESGPERVDLIVVYSIGRETEESWHEVGGWAGTSGPKWMHAAMMRRAANSFDNAALAEDDEDEDTAA